ncbi:MAG: hypothetical protein VX874_15790 [Pseudomonadota bacterium]|nr:hypothetical protein [Pseudomonadota bacterium]
MIGFILSTFAWVYLTGAFLYLITFTDSAQAALRNWRRLCLVVPLWPFLVTVIAVMAVVAPDDWGKRS